MAKFNYDKRGYNTSEVDNYINNLCLKYEEKLSEQKDRVFSLKNELDIINGRLQDFVEKDKQISQALMYAVEKADEVEEGAKKIYELEIKRVRLLYKRWEELLLEVEEKCPQVNTNNNLGVLVEGFKQAIIEVLEENTKISTSNGNVKQTLKNKSDNYIKNILNKMDYSFNTREGANKDKNVQRNIKKVDMSEILVLHDKERSRMRTIENKLTGTNKKEISVDNYLDSNWDDDFSNSVYAKTITRKKPKNSTDDSPFNYAYPTPNESGFDLREALNPKEELDEIMKSFDFYENDNN